MKPLPLALPPSSNQGESPHAGVAGLVNCYVVPEGDEQKSKLRIRAASGLDQLVTLPTSGGIRGAIEVDGVLYAVAGRLIYQIDSGGSAVLIGGLPSDGYVGMARNQRGTGVQTIVTCDGLSYVIAAGSLTRITDSDLIPAIDVCVINRSAIFVAADGRMQRSEIDDATSIDGLDLARAEANPDGLYRGVARGSDLIAIGQRSAEVWTDTGGEAFGFTRANVINIGAVGPLSVVSGTVLGQSVQDTVAWCANDPEGRFAGVIMLSGYTPQKISTAWIDRKVDLVADKTSITAMSWVERGRAFLAWRLTDTTIVYDTSTGQWHERKSRDAYGNETAWNIGTTAVLGGRVAGGHISAPSLYWIDPDVRDEDGNEMVMRVRSPPLSAYPGRIEVDRLWLDMVPGVGIIDGTPGETLDVLTDDDGEGLLDDDGAFLTDDGAAIYTGVPEVDPEVVLRVSRDGETWSGNRAVKLGKAGQRMTRIRWNRLGTHQTANFEFSCSASVVREILQASWEGTVLPP